MFLFDGNTLIPITNSSVLNRITSNDPWCYFCNSNNHIGRDCKEQQKVIQHDLLTEEIITKWSESSKGNFNEGCEIIDSNI